MKMQTESGKKLWETPKLMHLDVKSTKTGTSSITSEGVRIMGMFGFVTGTVS